MAGELGKLRQERWHLAGRRQALRGLLARLEKGPGAGPCHVLHDKSCGTQEGRCEVRNRVQAGPRDSGLED